MSVVINPYSDELVKRFESEKNRLDVFLDRVTIEHIGSSAVGIGGKNIVDILVGVNNADDLLTVRDLLAENGYFEGNDSHGDRIFMASSKNETGEGDFHIHICLVDSDTYNDFIRLRNYLRANPKKAQEYLSIKHKIANEVGFDRKKYKALKSEYVSRLLKEAKKRPPSTEVY